LEDKIAKLKAQMKELQGIESQLNESPDKQVSLTDPDARSMMTRGSGIVGYNVQTAVDTQHHLIVAHEVTNRGSDRDQLSSMAKQAREAIGVETLSVVADRGYFKGEEILACHDASITAYVPKPMTSSAKADGRFNKDAFVYNATKNEYTCPACAQCSAALGRPQSFMSDVERGVRRLDTVQLRDLCHVLGGDLVSFTKIFEQALAFEEKNR
jgi:hypothetical protein